VIFKILLFFPTEPEFL